MGLDDDVFYLTLEELLAYLNGENVKAVSTISQRRQTYERPQANPQAHHLNWTIIFRDWPYLLMLSQ